MVIIYVVREEDKNKSGHVTAVGVLRSFRNLGIATKVIKQTRNTTL